MTLTRGSVTAGQDLATLGVARGLTLNAGTAATGPGSAGGTVVFTNGGLAGTFITTTGPAPVTPTNIFYNPSSCATPTNYSTFFTGNDGPLTQYMLVYPGVADKTVAFCGFTLAQSTIVTGGTGANFALPVSCCAPIVGKTTGNINAAAVVVPPPVVTPNVTPPELRTVVPAPVVMPPAIVTPPVPRSPPTRVVTSPRPPKQDRN